MKVYHYKKIDKAIEEIEQGTIWFAKSGTLNDPIEGYLQIVWQGDRIAWEGLFKNYVCSLYHCMVLFEMGIDDEDLLKKDTVLIDIHAYDNLPIGRIYQRLASSFIHDDIVNQFISALEKNGACSADELCYWLFLIHLKALNYCAMENVKLEFMSEYVKDKKNVDYKQINELLAFLKNNNLTNENKKIIENTARVNQNLFEFIQIDNQEKWFTGNDEDERNRRRISSYAEIIMDFPYKYVEQLKQIIYPQGLVSCFSLDDSNSVMWSHYADNHRGVCLVYETETKDGKEYIPLKEKKVGNIIFPNLVQIKAVNYSETMVQRNFFESLGRLTNKKICSWLQRVDGEKSICFESYLNEGWREQYWSDYNAKYYTKMTEWAYEKEYRALIDTSFLPRIEGKGIALKYDHKALKGIIFGINTLLSDKIIVLKAIKNIWKDLSEFRVFDAKYNERDQRIMIYENTILTSFYLNDSEKGSE